MFQPTKIVNFFELQGFSSISPGLRPEGKPWRDTAKTSVRASVSGSICTSRNQKSRLVQIDPDTLARTEVFAVSRHGFPSGRSPGEMLENPCNSKKLTILVGWNITLAYRFQNGTR